MNPTHPNFKITSNDSDWILEQIEKWKYPVDKTGEAYLKALQSRLAYLTKQPPQEEK